MMPRVLRSILDQLTVASKVVATGMNVAGTLVVLGLVIIVNYDAISRGVFNQPFRGATEVVQFAMVLIVFLQLPDVCRVNRLTRSDGLLGLIERRNPKAAATMRRAINTLSATMMALIAIAIFPEFLDMWDTQDFFGIPGVFTAPWWPVKLTIFCGTALCALIFALKVLSRTGSDTPE